MGIEKLGITPGKWCVHESDLWPFDISIKSEDTTIISSSRCAYSTTQKGLEDVYAGVGFRPNQRQEVINANAEQKANHDIMAAAPEMLEALIEWADDGMFDGISQHDRVIKIIEKATGKTWDEIKELIK